MSFTWCNGQYRVLSYDATWTSDFGNQGRFVLERDGLTILAHCGSKSCGNWARAVGRIVVADRSVDDLITRYEPLCEIPSYVKNGLEMIKQNTGRTAAVAEVCGDTLIVEKIEAKTTK